MIETILIKGEPPCPRPRKWRVWWWFDNDEASAQNNTFYYRYVRNPFQNFRWYVIGFVDRDHMVTGEFPAQETLWADLRPPKTGWKNAKIDNRYPFWSYSGEKPESGGEGFVYYFGWQPRGGFGFRFTGWWGALKRAVVRFVKRIFNRSNS